MKCNICSSERFAPGYKGRLANNIMPSCTNCNSQERQRIIYKLFDSISKLTKNKKCLQFAPDNSLRAENFKTLTNSIYDGENSLDLMNLKLENNSFDIIHST